jgi:malate dehydrogenase
MLLKCSPLIDHLTMYDIVNTPGVATDLSHINTKCRVSGYLPADNGLSIALKDANILFVAVGSVVQKVRSQRF